MRIRHLAFLLLLVLIPAGSHAGVGLPSVADNTLYEDAAGGVSNGAGSFMFVGRASVRRRAVVRFDVAGNLPAGAIITNASLILFMSRTNATNSLVPIGLHRLTSSWSEGTSNAGDPGGSGAASTPGDATWIHTSWPGSLWTSPGGDFTATVTATTMVQSVGSYTWTSPQLVADVQDMLDNPAANFGWILVGDESPPTTNAKRFETRESAIGSGPILSIDSIDVPVGVEESPWSAVKALFR